MSQVNVHLSFSSLSTVISIIHPLNDLQSAEDIFRAHRWCSKNSYSWLTAKGTWRKQDVQLFWKPDAEILILSICQIHQFFGLIVMYTTWPKAFKFYKDMLNEKIKHRNHFYKAGRQKYLIFKDSLQQYCFMTGVANTTATILRTH